MDGEAHPWPTRALLAAMLPKAILKNSFVREGVLGVAGGMRGYCDWLLFEFCGSACVAATMMQKVSESLVNFDSVPHYLNLAMDTMARDRARREDTVTNLNT